MRGPWRGGLRAWLVLPSLARAGPSVLARRLASHVSLFSGSDLIGMIAGCVVPALSLGMAHIFVARSHFG